MPSKCHRIFNNSLQTFTFSLIIEQMSKGMLLINSKFLYITKTKMEMYFSYYLWLYHNLCFIVIPLLTYEYLFIWMSTSLEMKLLIMILILPKLGYLYAAQMYKDWLYIPSLSS